MTHTYLLTPSLLEKLTGPQLVKKFPAFYGICMFITTFTSARHLSLSWASSIQSMPSHPVSWRLLLSHLRLGLRSGLFPSDFHTKPCIHLSSPKIRATCSTHLIHLYFITQKIFGEEYRELSSSRCSFLHSPVTSSLLGPNIFLRPPVWNNSAPTDQILMKFYLSVNRKSDEKIQVSLE